MIARDFLTANPAAALATADGTGVPHVSIVYCTIDEDLTIYFSTRVQSRKFDDLMARPTMAMAFYDEPHLQTVQLTGTARRVEDFDKEQAVMGRLMKLRLGNPDWQTPAMKLFHNGSTNEIAVMEVIPDEMTFADFTTPAAGRPVSIFRKII